MKNIQVRVEDSVKDKSDKLFKDLGTSTNEAIKIFLQTSLNKNGFPFELKIDRPTDLLEWVEEQMLSIDEKAFMDAYMTVEGKYWSDDEFGSDVVNEIIEIKGYLDEEDDDVLLAHARVKIINSSKVDVWDAADADSGDFELVASQMLENTDVFSTRNKIAFLDEFFVFSKQITAENRVKLFMDQVMPYLVARDVEVVGFMNAGFWRTDAVEEQKALTKVIKQKTDIGVVATDKKWNSIVNMLDVDDYIIGSTDEDELFE